MKVIPQHAKIYLPQLSPPVKAATKQNQWAAALITQPQAFAEKQPFREDNPPSIKIKTQKNQI